MRLISTAFISILSYFLGRKNKEIQIIKNNEKKRKQYEKNKFNSITGVVNFLRK